MQEIVWAAVEELTLSYYKKETRSFTIKPYHGTLILFLNSNPVCFAPRTEQEKGGVFLPFTTRMIGEPRKTCLFRPAASVSLNEAIFSNVIELPVMNRAILFLCYSVLESPGGTDNTISGNTLKSNHPPEAFTEAGLASKDFIQQCSRKGYHVVCGTALGSGFSRVLVWK